MIFLVILVIALSIAILIGIWHLASTLVPTNYMVRAIFDRLSFLSDVNQCQIPIRIAILKAITKITKKIISVSTPSSISNNCRERLQSINNSRLG
ncbi:LOW QUALITY PROTEIN: putative translocon-associated protein, alpha subunit [Schistosoma mansoni]|uniref:putative translocon-associated protein, alpha subunit n=1 Tax=Schistosoma mansoni TaxID=6183 RepID=UPI00022DCA94|nr:LOW QUALITY PROTEIN: putative translocon-associated protein, alpha subunit [Schistosoma mansoni]|eukprot:XP_018655360.1 LOW QUALITY PROTEIN: putative translocon-associated protein, alpha subunit [Schistosoma mansoni]